MSEKLLSMSVFVGFVFSVYYMQVHACPLALILMIRMIYRSCWVELT